MHFCSSFFFKEVVAKTVREEEELVNKSAAIHRGSITDNVLMLRMARDHFVDLKRERYIVRIIAGALIRGSVRID